MFTVKEIANSGFEKFKVDKHASKESFEKKIRSTLVEKGVQSTGEKKSPNAKRNAKAYSPDIKDSIINDWLFDYLVNITKDEAVKTHIKSPSYYEEKARRENGRFEDETMRYLNLTSEQREKLQKEEDDGIETITKHSKKYIERKNEIMLEALFSKFYLLKSDELVADFNKIDSINNFKQGDYTKDDIRMLEKFSDWKNYIEKIT